MARGKGKSRARPPAVDPQEVAAVNGAAVRVAFALNGALQRVMLDLYRSGFRAGRIAGLGEARRVR